MYLPVIQLLYSLGLGAGSIHFARPAIDVVSEQQGGRSHPDSLVALVQQLAQARSGILLGAMERLRINLLLGIQPPLRLEPASDSLRAS
ncbi:hypothetical protein D3C87_1863140 [compost metagenome]